MSQDARAAADAVAAVAVADVVRASDAALDAANAGAAVGRALKKQLIYRGGCTLRAEVVNLSVEAFNLLSRDRGKSFNVDAQQYAATFGAASLYKSLRYGSCLVPDWPLHVSYNSSGTLKVTGKFGLVR